MIKDHQVYKTLSPLISNNTILLEKGKSIRVTTFVKVFSNIDDVSYDELIVEDGYKDSTERGKGFNKYIEKWKEDGLIK